MNIIGPDALVFGVDDVAACTQYLTDYGLTPVGNGRFEALDGTAIVIAHKDDASLPPSLGTMRTSAPNAAIVLSFSSEKASDDSRISG